MAIDADGQDWELYYGPFHGGDPTQFVPDDTCSTPEEQAKHREDCRKWFYGEYQDSGAQCETVNPSKSGERSIGYGLGTGRYKVTPEERFEMDDGYPFDIEPSPGSGLDQDAVSGTQLAESGPVASKQCLEPITMAEATQRTLNAIKALP